MYIKKAKIVRVITPGLYEAVIQLGFGIVLERTVRLKDLPESLKSSIEVKDFIKSRIAYHDILLMEEKGKDYQGNPLVTIFYGCNKRNLAQEIKTMKFGKEIDNDER